MPSSTSGRVFHGNAISDTRSAMLTFSGLQNYSDNHPNYSDMSTGAMLLAKHKCEYCSYSTLNVAHLREHKRIHTGEKPHPCPYCAYRGTWKHVLTRHIRLKHPEHLIVAGGKGDSPTALNLNN